MELKDAIYQRRAVRHYSARAVEPPLVEAIINAAVQAPSAFNQQPWVFAVFHGRKRLRDYSVQAKRFLVATIQPVWEVHLRSEMYADPNYDVFHGADTLIVIYARPGGLNPAEDCCMAAQNLMLSAFGYGLGSCPIGFLRQWLDQPETKRQLDVPEHFTAVFPVVVGYPEEPVEPLVKNAPDIVSWKWGDER
jgi:nitroreductase